MVKYLCNICNFESNDKSNYERHLRTKKHTTNEKENKEKNRRKFNCPNCECHFLTQSGMNRHLKTCVNIILAQKEKEYTNIIQTLEKELREKDWQIELMKKDVTRLKEVIKMKEEFNEKDVSRLTEVIKMKDENNKKIEDFLENENEYHKQLVDKTGKMVKTSMSALNFAKKHYPDAPALLKYSNMDAIKLDKIYGVGAVMIWHYENHTIAEAIGGIILKEYKKEDPSCQSLWNSDFARIAYIIMDDVNNKKQWIVDKGGVRVQELLVDPILEYIREKLIKRSVRKAKELVKNAKHPEKYILALRQCDSLVKQIDNGTVAGKVMKYLSKFLHIGNQMKAITE